MAEPTYTTRRRWTASITVNDRVLLDVPINGVADLLDATVAAAIPLAKTVRANAPESARVGVHVYKWTVRDGRVFDRYYRVVQTKTGEIVASR